MAYKQSKGEREFGDIEFEDDADTKIDFEQDYISMQTGGNNVLVVSGSQVGVGTASPDYTLDVAGDIGVNQYIYHNGDSNTWINFTDNRIRLNAGGNNFIDCEDPGSAPHKVRINNGGNNIDFVIKDNSNNVYFTADASTARIGIGTTSPSTTLSIAGSVSANVTNINNSYNNASTYNVGSSEFAIFCNTRPAAQGGIDSALTINLPDAATYPGRILVFKDAGGYSGTNAITIQRSGGDNINGNATSITLPNAAGGAAMQLMSDGASQWFEI